LNALIIRIPWIGGKTIAYHRIMIISIESNFVFKLDQTTIEYRDQLDSLKIGVLYDPERNLNIDPIPFASLS
jgi:hypothetical protein